MGMIQKFIAAFRGEVEVDAVPEVRRSTEPVPAVSLPSGAVTSEPLPSPEPQAPPMPPYAAAEESRPEQEPTPKAAGVKKVILDEAAVSILDLRELPSSRFRIVGSAYWVTDSGRYKHGGTEYLLVREPKNKWDANAVAVYGKGRKIGPIWVDLPAIPKFRAFAKTIAKTA
ncbi:HIRAN domain-containing protein [Arthrobacter sp. C152]